MEERLEALYARYRSRVKPKGHLMLLKPEDAIAFAGEVGALGVVNLMPELWHYVDGLEEKGLVEDPVGPDLTDLARERNATRDEPGWVGNLAEETAAAAQDYIRHSLPARTAYVSFVLELPLHEQYWQHILDHPMDEELAGASGVQ